METIEKQTYRGWIIQEDNGLWPRTMGPIKYFHEDHEGRYFNAHTIEEAKQEIDERVIEDLNKDVVRLEKQLAQKDERLKVLTEAIHTVIMVLPVEQFQKVIKAI